MLKERWALLPVLEQWRYLRSVAAREHLHFRVARFMNVPCGPILRMRRFAITRHLVEQGYNVDIRLMAYTLPKHASGEWLEDLCPWAGPSRVSDVVPSA
jgi:hypothetical protein